MHGEVFTAHARVFFGWTICGKEGDRRCMVRGTDFWDDHLWHDSSLRLAPIIIKSKL